MSALAMFGLLVTGGLVVLLLMALAHDAKEARQRLRIEKELNRILGPRPAPKKRPDEQESND